MLNLIEEEAKEVGMSNVIFGGFSQGGQSTLAIMPHLKNKVAGIYALNAPPTTEFVEIPKFVQDSPTLIYQLDHDTVFDIRIAEFLTKPYLIGNTTYVIEKDSIQDHCYTDKSMARLKKFIE